MLPRAIAQREQLVRERERALEIDVFAPPTIDLDQAFDRERAAPDRGGIVLGLGVVLLGRPLDRLGPSARLNRFLRDLLGAMRPNQALGVALLGSFAEELLFRGFLQPRLGLIATAVLFGAVHYVPRRKDLLIWPFAAAVMGLVFGGLYALCGGVLAPFVAHFTINYFNLHLLLAPRTES